MTRPPRLLASATALALLIAPMIAGAAPAHAVSTFTVTDSSGTGTPVPGSLAEAITLANASPGSTITFAPSVTSITLSGALPTITESVTIRGIEGSGVTISGNDLFPILRISGSGGSVTLANLTLTHGRETSGVSLVAGGAVQATLTSLIVQNCTFSSNVATASGKYVRGGAIYLASGSLSVSESTFSGNSATVTSGATREASGGAISANNSTVTISNSTFTGNSASSATGQALGGGVYSSDGSITVAGTSTWTLNTATGGDTSSAADGSGGSAKGGAIALAGSARTVAVTGTAAFNMNFVEGGDTTTIGSPVSGIFQGGHGHGGAIWTDGSVTIGTGASFTDNQARAGNAILQAATGYAAGTSGGFGFGGAIVVDGTSASSTLTVSGANFLRNTAFGGTVTATSGGPFSPRVNIGDSWGGAVTAIVGTLTITSSTFTDNIADGGTSDEVNSLAAGQVHGGAVLLSAPSGVGPSVSIASSTFNGNVAVLSWRTVGGSDPATTGRKGGALYAEGSGSGGSLTVSNSTFTANVGTQGSAINLDSFSGLTTSLSSLTIASNTSPDVSNSALNVSWAGTTLTNSIINGNGVTNPCRVSPATALTVTFSLIDTGSCGTSGAGVITGDPLLGSLASNGGPTQTMALGAGSPALLVADSAACQASPVSGVDQRGVARPAGRCDMGAYQRSEALPTPDSGGGSGSGSGGGGGGGSESSTPSNATSSAASTGPVADGSSCSVGNVAARQGDRAIAVSWTVTGTACTTTATATPMSRAKAPVPASCTSTGSGCVISGLTPGVRYGLSVVTRGQSGGASPAAAASPVIATRHVREYIVVPFAPGSTRIGAQAMRAIRAATRGAVVEMRVAGYADSGTRQRVGLARARAEAVRKAAARTNPGVPIEAGAGALRNRRCADVDFGCAVLRVTRSVTPEFIRGR